MKGGRAYVMSIVKVHKDAILRFNCPSSATKLCLKKTNRMKKEKGEKDNKKADLKPTMTRCHTTAIAFKQ